MSKIKVHSPGMISIDAIDFKPNAKTLAYLKNAKIFKELVSMVGERHARHVVLGKITKTCKFCTGSA